ncbi:MAG: hypothetical protein K0Q94_6941 [Paenibacillus sp.]|nr:hypothetical protein [Paenibacillus sp.]
MIEIRFPFASNYLQILYDLCFFQSRDPNFGSFPCRLTLSITINMFSNIFYQEMLEYIVEYCRQFLECYDKRFGL